MNPIPETLSPLKRMFRLIRSERSEIRNIYIFAAFSGLLSLSLPLGIQAILNFLNSGELSTSWIVLVFFVILSIAVVGILQIKQLGITEHIEQRIFAKAAFDFAYRIPRIRQSAVQNKYLPELVNRFFEIQTIQKGLSKILLDFSTSAIQIVFGLFLLSLYHPLFILFGILLVLIVYLIFKFTGPAGLRTSLEESKYKFEVAHWLEEIGRTMTTFKLIGNSNLPEKNTDELVSGYLKSRRQHFRILVWQYSAMIAFKVLVAAGLLILGSFLVIDKQINIGQFVASEIIILLIINSVEKLILSMSNIYDVLTALEKIGMVTDLPLEKNTGTDLRETKCEQGLELSIKDLEFTFPDADRPCLKNISVSVAPGESLVIAGKLGAGKTTLLRLMAGMFDEFKGVISYNGFPMGNLRVEALRGIIGDNFTEAEVFQGTFYENIHAGRPEVSFDDVRWAVKMTLLEEHIQSLPLGYDTPIDPEGRRLSSGVMRKIIMARAMAERPKMMLIEDTLTNLPEEERKLIFGHILDTANGWTVVLITSDKMLAAQCHKVMVLDEGQVLEINPYQQLVHKEKAFGIKE